MALPAPSTLSRKLQNSAVDGKSIIRCLNIKLCHTVCVCLQDAKFVEERRKQLQGYLRMVMNKLIQTLPEFTARPTKETLLSLLPFCL